MANSSVDRLLRRLDVLAITGWSNSTLYNRIAEGSFKPGIKIGPRMVAWPATEVQKYIQTRIDARDQSAEGA